MRDRQTDKYTDKDSKAERQDKDHSQCKAEFETAQKRKKGEKKKRVVNYQGFIRQCRRGRRGAIRVPDGTSTGGSRLPAASCPAPAHNIAAPAAIPSRT